MYPEIIEKNLIAHVPNIYKILIVFLFFCSRAGYWISSKQHLKWKVMGLTFFCEEIVDTGEASNNMYA